MVPRPHLTPERLRLSALLLLVAVGLAACGASAPDAIADVAAEAETGARLSDEANPAPQPGENPDHDREDREDRGAETGEPAADDHDDAVVSGMATGQGTATDGRAGCSITDAVNGADISWWDIPLGSDIHVVDQDGTVLAEAVGPEGVLTLFGATVEPESGYQLELRSIDSVEHLDCAVAAAEPEPSTHGCPVEPTEGQTGPATPTGCGQEAGPDADPDSHELVAAKARFEQVALGPHAYVTMVDQGRTVSRYMLADGTGRHAFRPPIDDPELVDPFTVHDELLAAIEAGSVVDYELDDGSDLPIWWTVDGTTRELLCLELDTAPPELRVGPCDPAIDLLGRDPAAP